MNSKNTKQSGFIVLMGMLALVVGAGIWFGTLGNLRSNTMKIANNDKHINELHLIKDRMLAYAVMHPEIYSDAASIPGPGYFPCPDVNNDGYPDIGCDQNLAGTNKLFVLGKVPFQMAVLDAATGTLSDNHNFTFIDSKLNNGNYWYAVDARFVNSSARYATGSWARFSNLNNAMSSEVSDSGGTSVFPFTVDGKDDIVMVLFYSGEPLTGQNRPSASPADYLEQSTVVDGSTIDFKSVGANSSVFNDYVITITRSEWEAAVLSRVAEDTNPQDSVPDMCTISDTDVSWFNECKYISSGSSPPFSCTYDSSTGAVDNLQGQGWRALICP
ncbi:hypothetical protein JCM30760_20460 [Thiomicrorhabdus hydrogeniphila]